MPPFSRHTLIFTHIQLRKIVLHILYNCFLKSIIIMQFFIGTLFTLLLFNSCCSCHKLSKGVVKQTNFNVEDYGAVGDATTDDSLAFLNAWKDVCMTNANSVTLKVTSGKTFLLNPLKFNGPCRPSSIRFQLQGNLVAPKNIKVWKKQDSSRWIDFLNVNGLIINGPGQIVGRGSLWWKKGNSRPTALFFHNCNNLQLSGTHHLNSGKNHISLNYCKNANIFGITVTAPQDSPNTDGIDISHSTYVHIQDSIFATGDDCIAMNNGTSNVNITRVTCGPGHGISVGSLGQKGAYDIVEHIYVKNCTFKRTENGMRIKTWQGGSGYARNITFEQIILIDTKNPIIIDQNYDALATENDQQKIQKSSSSSSAVQISGVTYRNVHGTSDSSIAINLDCSGHIGCTDIFMDAINITSSSSGTTKASCTNAHGEAISTSPPVPCLK